MNFYCENICLLNTVPVSSTDLSWLVLLKSSQISENGALPIAVKQLTFFRKKEQKQKIIASTKVKNIEFHEVVSHLGSIGLMVDIYEKIGNNENFSKTQTLIILSKFMKLYIQ